MKILWGLVAIADLCAAAAWTAYGTGFLPDEPHFGAFLEAATFLTASVHFTREATSE